MSNTNDELHDQILTQCVRVKQEIGKLQELVKQIKHDENRKSALSRCDQAHCKFQEVQTFLQTR